MTRQFFTVTYRLCGDIASRTVFFEGWGSAIEHAWELRNKVSQGNHIVANHYDGREIFRMEGLC